MDVLESNQRIRTLNQNIESEKDRPWRKPGVDISDYFNYGFDEESWKAYCGKQAKLQLKKHRSRKEVTFMAQAAHAGYEEEEPYHACSFSGGQSYPASRESNTNTVMSGGQAGCSSREEEYPCLSDETNNTQVAAEISCKEDSVATCHLPPKVNINTPFAFVPPPPLLFRPGCHPLLPSVHPEGFDGPSTSLYHCSSVTGNLAVSAPEIDTAKAWECYIRQEKHDNDKDRERGNDKRRKRRRGREKQDSSSSYNRGHMRREKKRWCHGAAQPTENDQFLVGKEEMKHMNSAAHGYKHHRSERDSGDKKKRHKSKRHRRTSQSSRKDDDEARDRRQTQ